MIDLLMDVLAVIVVISGILFCVIIIAGLVETFRGR